MIPYLIVVVYNKSTTSIADYIANNYHQKYLFKYLDDSNKKEVKEAFTYKNLAGARLTPFIGVYDEDGEIVTALWSETTTFTNEEIDNFFATINTYAKNYN